MSPISYSDVFAIVSARRYEEDDCLGTVVRSGRTFSHASKSLSSSPIRLGAHNTVQALTTSREQIGFDFRRYRLGKLGRPIITAGMTLAEQLSKAPSR